MALRCAAMIIADVTDDCNIAFSYYAKKALPSSTSKEDLWCITNFVLPIHTKQPSPPNLEFVQITATFSL